MKKFKRVFMIVTDSLGIGADEDQKAFGDEGANTFKSAATSDLFEINEWKKMGIGNIANLDHKWKVKKPSAYVMPVQEISNAKDTLAGHWEMMGVKTEKPFPTFFENGFPKELIDELSKAFDNKKIVGNKSASGTEIIDELAHEERDNNAVIVYTSFDSVLQICANEAWIGLDKLYEYSKKARAICSSRPEWNVGRIIARPYVGDNGKYTRTFNRHDYANVPPRTILNNLIEHGVEVISVGKINDIFVASGISKHIPSGSDNVGMDITIDLAMEKGKERQLIFTNLVEFDSHYGHRRNVDGYGQNITNFDIKLAKLVNALTEDDLLIITSDHGNDPAYPGFNHTRELLPLTIYSKAFKNPKVLPTVTGMMTSGNLIAKNFDVPRLNDLGEDISELLV
ncbi:phosphopentomutase [Mycoplasmopsis agassizii]|uniref:Phosphopentomutase n=1 Tax=Mycoplasmopsis agassizii TaxID=33922 RepID=A0ABX4H4D6_9BACT|nr:phosphopentomutase [Mycoplasmopsis agassizii]PAF54750.1 phosphopentomutase [Mycoplasmopsis agassizii]SMC20067.1 phosphopentomutase [Mycoplasmopsis agassizii]